MNKKNAQRPVPRVLLALLLIYLAASLLHFVHNAEFLSAYPGLPRSWTRGGVYGVWVGMIALGLAGWGLLRRGFQFTGLSLVAICALIGLDSLGHYLLAPMSSHTMAMNATILLEVGAAALVLIETGRCMRRVWLDKRSQPRALIE